MKELLCALFFMPCMLLAEGPIMDHKDTVIQQEFENVYSDIRRSITISSSSTTNFITSSSVTATYLSLSSATANFLTQSSATATYLQKNGGTMTGILNVPNTFLRIAGFQTYPILQVQSFTTTTSSETTSTSFTDSTLSVSITPKISSSKILIWMAGTAAQGVGADGYITIARNGTNLGDATGGFHGMVSNNNYQVSMVYLDSPGTTSALTYTARIRTGAGGIQTFFPYATASANHTAVAIAAEIAH